jgi:ATP-dependent helicase/DNAse subunit B
MTDTITEAGPDSAAPPSGSGNPDYMSYSRMNSILTCGEQFRLERVLKMPSREHWASIGGNAFHSAVEKILKASLLEGKAI